MRHPFIGVLVGGAGVLVAAGFWPHAAEASHANESRRASIVVRTYTESGSEGAIQTARHTAGLILGRAGVEVGLVGAFEAAVVDDGAFALISTAS